jgi:hypothetical protein
LCHFKKLIPIKDVIKELEDFKKEIIGSPKTPSEIKLAKKAEEKEELMTESITQAKEKKSPPKGISEKEVVEKLMQNLQKEKSSLAAILAQYSSVKLKEEESHAPGKKAGKGGSKNLEIYFPGRKKFYMDALQKEIDLLEKAAYEIFKEKVKVKISEEVVEKGNRREAEVEIALKDRNVQYFMDLFKAQVISVEPIKRAKDRE